MFGQCFSCETIVLCQQPNVESLSDIYTVILLSMILFETNSVLHQLQQQQRKIRTFALNNSYLCTFNNFINNIYSDYYNKNSQTKDK
jgi:hypothetical protein